MRPTNVKKCSSLVIREMQIKITLRYHLMPVRMVIIKKSGDNRCWKGCEEIEHFYTVGGSVNQFSYCGRQCGNSSRTQKQKYHLTQQSHYQVYIQRITNCSIIKIHFFCHKNTLLGQTTHYKNALKCSRRRCKDSKMYKE